LSLSAVGANIEAPRGVGLGEGISPYPENFCIFKNSKWWDFVHACMDFCLVSGKLANWKKLQIISGVF